MPRGVTKARTVRVVQARTIPRFCCHDDDDDDDDSILAAAGLAVVADGDLGGAMCRRNSRTT